ncbi:hypothetical protein LINPERHAP2_LOCUS22737 [Linum perenne]
MSSNQTYFRAKAKMKLGIRVLRNLTPSSSIFHPNAAIIVS